MEKKLVCPNCGEPFEIDEKGYAAIAKQVRDKEFKEELTRQQASLEAESGRLWNWQSPRPRKPTRNSLRRKRRRF